MSASIHISVVTAVVLGGGEAHQLCPGSIAQIGAIVGVDVNIKTYLEGWPPCGNRTKGRSTRNSLNYPFII